MKFFLAIPVIAIAASAALGGQWLDARAFPAAPTAESAIAADKQAPTEPSAPDSTAGADETRAREILAQFTQTYPDLEGTTVRMGETPKGEEAVAYYSAGEIVIDRDHTVDVATILAHEIWHVIDWRDNGRLDWGEDLPPSNAADYR